MKTPIHPEVRQQVLDLRRSHSLSEVSKLTSLPVGTVKTICSRSGAFRDNQMLRSLCKLPPFKQGDSTALVVPELPPQQVVTGDFDTDAVLWLRSVIASGQPALIEKAMLAVKRIKTPLKELEDRYTKHLVSKNPGHFAAAWGAFGFSDLEGLAVKSVQRLVRQHEATSRFGNTLFDATSAEQFCIETLEGLKPGRMGFLDDTEVDRRFNCKIELTPNTLSDCLYELAYWHDLYVLRSSIDTGDAFPEGQSRDWYIFRCLAHIRPRSKVESIEVLQYLAKSERMGMRETNAILLNLMG